MNKQAPAEIDIRRKLVKETMTTLEDSYDSSKTHLSFTKEIGTLEVEVYWNIQSEIPFLHVESEIHVEEWECGCVNKELDLNLETLVQLTKVYTDFDRLLKKISERNSK